MQALEDDERWRKVLALQARPRQCSSIRPATGSSRIRDRGEIRPSLCTGASDDDLRSQINNRHRRADTSECDFITSRRLSILHRHDRQLFELPGEGSLYCSPAWLDIARAWVGVARLRVGCAVARTRALCRCQRILIVDLRV